MEHIDDFMRQKFDSDDPKERFEFREEYWEQAQVLLEQEEARRRRRWWLFFGLALAIALLACFLAVQWDTGSLSQNTVGEGDSMVGNTQHDKKSSEGPLLENLSQSKEVESPIASKNENPAKENAQRGLKAESSELKTLVTHKTKQSRLDKKDVAKPANLGKTQGKYTKRNRLGSDAQNLKKLSLTEIVKQSPFVKQDLQNPGDAENTLDKNTHDSEGVHNSDLLDEAFQLPVEPSSPPEIGRRGQAEAKASIIIPIAILPTPLTPLVLPARVVAPRKVPTTLKEPIAERIKPIEYQRFSLGLSFAGSAYQADTNGLWAGWALGAYGGYRLNNRLSLTLGAQWRFLPGHSAFTQSVDSQNPNFVEQLRYSFGYQRKEWKVETRGLHYLEIPLSARWEIGRWGLEGGTAAGMLFLVQNRTEYTEESSLEAAKTEIKKVVKGNAKPYNQTCLSAFAGAEYRLNDRLSVMARGQYRFTPVVKSLGEGVKNQGLGNVDLGLRIRLF